VPFPNILYVFDDQHRHCSLGSSGNQVVRTPNFDRLAAEGTTLDNALACHPLCSPYRAQLLTGQYSHQTRVVDNEYMLQTEQKALPELLGDAGYRTGFIGKWHLGYGPYPEQKRHGFDYLAAYNCGYGFYETSYYENERGPIVFDGWSPKGETELAIRFMKEARGDGHTPFALFVCWAAPHWPYDQYPQQFNTYNASEIAVRPNVPEPLAPFARRELAQYYGNISALDYMMGRLLGALDRLGLAEETLVCFTSDHGDHLWSHGFGKPYDDWLHPGRRGSKMTPFDESVHVPFIARWPGHVPADARSDGLFSSVDIMPTLLSLCGLEAPQSVQGVDLSHLLTGDGGPRRDAVYLQNMGYGWPPRREGIGFWRGVRTERWTYARWLHDGTGTLLFDRDSDPYEMENLAGREEFGDTQGALEERLQRFMTETGDPFETGERDPAFGMLKLGQRFADERWAELERVRLG